MGDDGIYVGTEFKYAYVFRNNSPHRAARYPVHNTGHIHPPFPMNITSVSTKTPAQALRQCLDGAGEPRLTAIARRMPSEDRAEALAGLSFGDHERAIKILDGASAPAPKKTKRYVGRENKYAFVFYDARLEPYTYPVDAEGYIHLTNGYKSDFMVFDHSPRQSLGEALNPYWSELTRKRFGVVARMMSPAERETALAELNYDPKAIDILAERNTPEMRLPMTPPPGWPTELPWPGSPLAGIETTQEKEEMTAIATTPKPSLAVQAAHITAGVAATAAATKALRAAAEKAGVPPMVLDHPAYKAAVAILTPMLLRAVYVRVPGMTANAHAESVLDTMQLMAVTSVAQEGVEAIFDAMGPVFMMLAASSTGDVEDPTAKLKDVLDGGAA